MSCSSWHKSHEHTNALKALQRQEKGSIQNMKKLIQLIKLACVACNGDRAIHYVDQGGTLSCLCPDVGHLP